MSDLREMMEAALGATPSPEGALQQTKGRIRRRQRRGTIATGATALLLSAAAIGFLWTGFLGDRALVNTAATPSADTGSVEPVVVANVAVGDFPSQMTTGAGSIWVSVGFAHRGDGVVARIDPATNQVTSTIPVDGLPGQLAIEAGSLWIGVYESVQRIDPESGRVIAEIAGPGSSLTATPGAVWTVDSANSIARIDPTTNQVVATVTLDLPASGNIYRPVGTPDAVWVMATLGGKEGPGGGSGVLFRIDPSTSSVVARIDLEMARYAFAVGDGSVWVVSDYGLDRTTLTRIDAATDQAAERIDVERGWTPFAVGAGRLWLMGGMQPRILVAGLNLSTLELEEPVVVGELPAFPGSGIFDPETNALWISQAENSVTRVDLRSTTSDARISTPS